MGLKKVKKQWRDGNIRRLFCCRKVVVKKDWMTILLQLPDLIFATKLEKSSSLSLPRLFYSRIVFSCFLPFLVFVLFSGPSLLAHNFYPKNIYPLCTCMRIQDSWSLGRAFSSTRLIQTKEQLYIALIRSQLLYCSPIWHPHLIQDISNVKYSNQDHKFILWSCSLNYYIGTGWRSWPYFLLCNTSSSAIGFLHLGSQKHAYKLFYAFLTLILDCMLLHNRLLTVN